MTTGIQDSDGFPGTTATKATPTTSDTALISDAADSGKIKKATLNSMPYVQKAGDTMTGLLVLSGDPVTALGACTKQYADAMGAGLEVKDSVVAASTAALTVTYANGASGVGATLTNAGAMAAFSLDGVSPTVGQRVLIKDQASTFQNGIYTVTTVGSGAVNWVLTRATDFDQVAEIFPGVLVIVTGGTTNGTTSWLQTATVATIGTDPITFTQFSSAPLALPVSLTNGGTNKALTASNGGIVYTDADSMEVLAGTATAGQIIRSGSSAAPSWSTATYPNTVTANRLLYASANDVISDLATANNSVLATNGSGVPSLTTSLPTAVQVAVGSLNSGSSASSTTFWRGDGTWSTVSAGGGGLTLIATATASASATVNFDNYLTSTYDNYIVVIENLTPATDGVYLKARIGTGGTPTYQATNYIGDVLYSATGGVIGRSNSATTAIDLGSSVDPQTNSANYAGGGIVHIFGANTSKYKTFHAHLVYQYTTLASLTQTLAANQWSSTTVITSIQFFMSSGNITTGTFKLYGYTN